MGTKHQDYTGKRGNVRDGFIANWLWKTLPGLVNSARIVDAVTRLDLKVMVLVVTNCLLWFVPGYTVCKIPCSFCYAVVSLAKLHCSFYYCHSGKSPD
jgi:hypothetical protein